MISRRALLAGGLGLTGLGALGALQRAQAGPVLAGRKFLFLFARGGWDTTRCFSPLFGRPSIETEPEASVAEASGLTFVDHPDRPAVRRFFEQVGAQTSIIDGMLVRSVNHAVCERIVLTGSSRAGSADWPTQIGAAWSSALAVPSLVISGPTEPGDLHRYSSVSGKGDQLQALISGTSAWFGTTRSTPLGSRAESVVDRFMQERSAARLSAASHPADQRMLDAYDDGLARALRLRDDAAPVPIRTSLFREELMTAVGLLAHGVCRCVSVGLSGWDTHAVNTAQSALYEQFFDNLLYVVRALQVAPGAGDGSLARETVIVVLSEMGRAPYLNGTYGKDHWPYTAAMLIGAGIAGGRQLGSYDDHLNGQAVDLVTGAPSSSGVVITPDHLGATLLTLAGLNPETELPGVEPIHYLLA